MTALTLRPAAAADFDLCRTNHHAAYRDLVRAVFGRWDEVEQNGYFAANWDPAVFQVLLCDDRPCGQVAVLDRADHLYVEELVVHPDYQNRGIGEAVLRLIQNRARQRGLPVRLQTRHVNPALRLYRRVGFCDTGRTDTHVLLEWPASDGERRPDDHDA